MNALGTVLVDCVAQVTLFVLAAAAVYLAAARRDPAAAARTVLASLIGVTLLTAVCWSPWPNWSNVVERSLASTDTHSGTVAADVAGVPLGPSVAVHNDSNATARPADVATRPTSFRSMWEGLRQVWVAGDAAPQMVARWSWRTFAVGAFVAAATLGFGRLLAGMACVASLRRRGTPLHDPPLTELADVLRAELGCSSRIALGESQRLTTAATIGWNHPLILLPGSWRTWSPRELRAVLAHEIAHIRRRDFASHLAAQVALALHFYHPLVHWLLHRLRLEQELAADAAAARVAGGPHSYLTTLAGLALAQPAARMAWPVHAFVPTRHMFLRRIEMLRDRRMPVAISRGSRAQEKVVGWLTAVVLCGAGLAVVGLRAPTTARAQSQVADAPARSDSSAPTNQQAQQPAVHSGQYDFSYVPENTMALFAVRPAELAADLRLRPLTELLEENTRPPLPSKLVKQAALVLVAPDLDEQGRFRAGFSPEQIVIHTTEPADFEAYLKKGYPSLREVPDGGFKILATDGNAGAMSFFMPDTKTLLGRVRSGLVQLLVNRNAALPPKSAEKWQADAKGPFFVVVQGRALSEALAGQTGPITALLGPLLKGSDTLTVSIEPRDELCLIGRLACKTPDDAKRAAETLNALAVIGQNAADSQRERIPPNSPDAAAAATAFKLIDQCLARRKVTISGNDVQIETSLGKTDDVATMIVESLAPAVRAARAAAQRTTSTNNLKQIALAMHNYHDKEKHFPPAVLLGPDGKTPHSWRVALLPYLDQESLYKQYQFDRPWDSAENRKVLEEMPTVYRHPSDESGSFSTSYFVFTGPDTAFSDTAGKGTGIAEIRDGTSRTIMAVEAKRHTPWTKPEDIAYMAGGPVPKLGGWSEGAFNAALCDGSVRPIADAIGEKLLRAMITRSGGEAETLRE